MRFALIALLAAALARGLEESSEAETDLNEVLRRKYFMALIEFADGTIWMVARRGEYKGVRLFSMQGGVASGGNLVRPDAGKNIVFSGSEMSEVTEAELTMINNDMAGFFTEDGFTKYTAGTYPAGGLAGCADFGALCTDASETDCAVYWNDLMPTTLVMVYGSKGLRYVVKDRREGCKAQPVTAFEITTAPPASAFEPHFFGSVDTLEGDFAGFFDKDKYPTATFENDLFVELGKPLMTVRLPNEWGMLYKDGSMAAVVVGSDGYIMDTAGASQWTDLSVHKCNPEKCVTLTGNGLLTVPYSSYIETFLFPHKLIKVNRDNFTLPAVDIMFMHQYLVVACPDQTETDCSAYSLQVDGSKPVPIYGKNGLRVYDAGNGYDIKWMDIDTATPIDPSVFSKQHYCPTYVEPSPAPALSHTLLLAALGIVLALI